MPAGQIRRRLIEHRLHVGERDLVEELAEIVGIEGAPAAVPTLHAERPVHPALDRVCLVTFIRHRDPSQHHQDDGGVVGIRVPVVRELEGPAAGLEVGILHLPVAALEDLVLEKPLGGTLQCRVVARGAGVEERFRRERRVPGRRDARLKEELAALLDHEVFDRLDPLGDRGMIVGIAERTQRHHRVHHRRLDPAPTAVHVLMREDPIAGGGERARPQRRHRDAAEELQRLVDDEEKVVPRERARAAAKRVVGRRRRSLE